MSQIHTPLPWKLIDEARNHLYREAVQNDPGGYEAKMQHCYYIAGPRDDSHFIADLIVDFQGQANAAYIVRACNAFPQLLEACKAAAEYVNRMMASPYDPPSLETMNAVNYAIRLAEKQP